MRYHAEGLNFAKFYNSGPSPADPRYSWCVIVWAVKQRRVVLVKFAVVSVRNDTGVGAEELVAQVVVELVVLVQSDLARGHRIHIAERE